MYQQIDIKKFMESSESEVKKEEKKEEKKIVKAVEIKKKKKKTVVIDSESDSFMQKLGQQDFKKKAEEITKPRFKDNNLFSDD